MKMRSLFRKIHFSAFVKNRVFVPLSASALLILLVFFTFSDISQPTPSPEVGYTSVSPHGAQGGVVIPASCPSDLHDDPWYGAACSACSACGCNSGTLQCSGTPEYGIWNMGTWWGERFLNALGLSWSSSGIINPAGSPGACSVGAPALPAGYGSACQGPANACGSANSGTINCSGVCSAAAMPNPRWLGSACSASNVCGATNSGTYLCSGFCSVGAPALPAGYGSACTSAANACGWTATGTLDCSLACTAGVPAMPAGYGNVCQGPANACGMTIAGTIGCSGCTSTVAPSDALCDLAVCKNSCVSTLDRTGSFTVASGPPATTLKACFYQAGTGACASGVDVTGSATWTETNAPKDAMYFSPTGVLNARYVNGDEVFNVSYLGVNKSPQVTVVCIPNTCSIAPAKVVTDTYCPEVTQDTGVPTGCDGMTLVCPGTRKCNYNWRETAP